jgi:hypothetical protein
MSSGLVDAELHLRDRPDVAKSGRSPAGHYLEGHLCGCRPNPIFHARWRLENSPDASQAGHNPLLHYLHHGHREGRNPGPEFQTEFYLEANPDLRARLAA